MDAVNLTILKKTIKEIPVLTKDNFSIWKTQITTLFKLGSVKEQILEGEPALEDTDNTIIYAILISKISWTTHNNVVNSFNKDNAHQIWKSIMKRFMAIEHSLRLQ